MVSDTIQIMILFTQISVPVASTSKKSRSGKGKVSKSVRNVPCVPTPPPPDNNNNMDFNNHQSSPLLDLFDPALDDIIWDVIPTQIVDTSEFHELLPSISLQSDVYV